MTGVRPRLLLLLLAAFVVRLFFIGDQGFKNDIDSFEAWALTLATHPMSQFYASTKFVDYPTGYFYILWIVGHAYSVISPHGNFDVLRVLVKMPAILMDLVTAALLYLLVRRYASERWALGAAALFAFNPAVIFISASWGQVDSVAAGLALAAAYLLLRSDDFLDGFAWRIPVAWVLLAYSLLIKPQAVALVPLFIVFAFASPELRVRRLMATGVGIVAAIAFAFLLTVPFHPGNPVAALSWLYQRYEIGKDVYAVNSVNAFNLWSIVHPFWQPDSQLIAVWPQYLWGVVLAGIALVLILVRYVQARTQEAFVEAAALSTLAFFMLSTRMHERYLFDGLLFTIAAAPIARRYAWAAVIFSVTLLVNLFYSLTYLTVVVQSIPGVNPRDMWPLLTHPLSALNVLAFFYLGYIYLGQTAQDIPAAKTATSAEPSLGEAFLEPLRGLKGRAWFDPREGLARMLWPLDYGLAALFGVISFILSFVNYWIPKEKIFDEIYFARAAEEYLSHKYIYENTHPPLTKLIITVSTMLFGGDNAHGWRFLDVVFGALAIVLIYIFAKRLTRSSLFASFAAIIFTADGMHFVQSRIATPEGIVVVFALGTLYAFYRFWIASQSTLRAYEPETFSRAGISALAALAGGYALSALVTMPFHQSRAAFVVTGLYLACGLYLLLRLAIVPRLLGRSGEFGSYAEGSRLYRQSGTAATLETPDGRTVRGKTLQIAQDGLKAEYDRDGSVRYQTPDGSATYSPGLVTTNELETQEGRHAGAWLVVFTILLGALVASKWYGVMAYGVSFVVIAFVWAQRYWGVSKPKTWGNPFGFRLDITIAATLFLSMTVYALVWVPDFIRQIEIKNLTDLIYRQYSMFMYHDTLKATHPYSSVFWMWPIDWRPIAYYWNDSRTGIAAAQSTACCVAEIMSLPNPFILWPGLACVPIVGFLAWRERNKGYALLVIAYLLQWLPWWRSPRITFIYHFYVDIPLIVLCNVIVLQRIWQLGEASTDGKWLSRAVVCGYVAAVVGAFIWFYPVLAAVPIPWDHWSRRMWLPHWII